MLFDGAVAATVAEAAQPTDHATASTDAAKAPTSDHAAASSDTHAQSDATPAATPTAVPGQSVVFVDSRVKDFDSLLKGVAPGTQVVVLDASKDGLQQIADYLDTHQGISTVEILAHGNAGDLWLGNTYLSADNVAARADVLARIGSDMNVGGDILIYACNTAAGDKGISFVDSLAQYTGRDIAASTNRTGLGGDWTLEIATGTIESHNVLSADAMAAYQYGLATITVTNSNDTGAGSLRQALSDAVAGDIVTFNSAMTVNLNSQLVITKNLTVDGDLNNDGTADVTVSGQYKTQVLRVNAGVTATLDGLVITKGLAVGQGANAGSDASVSMGGGIVNLGNLTLNNVTVTANAASGGGGGGGVRGGTVGGGGGGGGALGGQAGGRGGDAGNGQGYYAGKAGTANTGGNGGGYNPTVMGGRGGSSTGGAGGQGAFGYSNGGGGGTANNGTLSIGGGGGGSGWDSAGRAGAAASGGIYNGTTGTLTIVGTSVISNNVAAGGGGGGGGGSGAGASSDPGGAGGKGVGAIWNRGTLRITAANYSALGSGSNKGASGIGGSGAGGQGATPSAVDGIYNDGGVLNTAYNPAPTATIVVSNTTQHIGSTSLVTITFNQAVTGFALADLTASNGTLSNLTTSDNITWTATLTPNSSVSSASNVITLDNTGVNSTSTGTAGSGTTTSNNYSVDTVRPTATITVASATLTTNNTSTVNITFSEAVSGFSLADMTATNGTLSNLSTSDNIHWTATLTPNAGNTSNNNYVLLDNSLYTDASGNTGAGVALSNLYAVDTQRPTATIVVSNNTLNIGGSSLVTITFSEAVSGFSLADLTASNGTLSNLTSSDNITWTATLTPTNGVTHSGDVVTLTNSGVTDLVGNAGTGTTNSNTYSVDTQRPTATIVFANPNIGIGQTSQVTITFSEAVSGFTNDDLTVTNGTLSTVTSSDGGVTWTATFTPTAGVDSASNHVTLDNSGVVDGAGNAGSGTTTSNNYAIDGVRPTATVAIDKSSLIIGQTAQVTITFSEAVTNFSNSDLTVSGGSLSAVSSSDGGITWTATFTPTGNITNASNVITLDNTGYTDTAGNAGTGTSVSNNYAIDTQRPTATIVMSDPTLSAGETSQVTITFSEAVTGFTLGDLNAGNGTLSNLSSSDGGITWTATFTPNANTSSGTNVITLANTGVTDIAGNSGTGTTSSVNYTIDTVRPTATIVVANPALKIGDTSQVTITFSQAVSGFTNADLTVVGGTLSAVSSADGGITWTATFTPAGNISNAANHITLDNSGVNAVSSGNAGTGLTTSNNYVIDTQRPTATIVVADNQLGIAGSSQVTITFSEAVTGFSLADLTASNGTLSNLSTSDNITWTATLTPAAGVNASNNHVSLDNTGVTDVAGNAGSGATASNAYAVDSVRPTATIVMSDPTLSAGESTTVTITFSEAVTGFDNSDLSLPNGTLSTLTSSDGGITWTGTFTPNANVRDTSNVLTLNNTGYTDLAGNTGVGVTNSANFTIDTVRPTATIVVANPALNVGSTSQVTITFSEAVSGFTNADLTVEQGTLSAVSSSDGGVTWTATFTPSVNIADTTNVITLDNSGVQNASGNAGSGTTTSNNYAIDTQRPTATITVANPNLGIGQTTTVTIAFSEVVSGFSLADLSVANGVLSNLASSDGGKTWTATLTPTAAITDPSNLIVLDTALVNDNAGNAGADIAISNNYVIDGDRPTATIVVANPNLTAGQSTTVTFTFSEKVTGFSLDDLSVASGTLSNLASSDGGKTWTATLTPTANLNDPSNFITLDTSLVTDLAGNAGVGFANSNNYAINTVAQGGDPQFRVSGPSVSTPSAPNQPLQPTIFGPPTGNLGSPLGFPPLFEQRDMGAGLPPTGSIFLNNGALAPSFIAQVFSSSDSGGNGTGQGFLGFGGGDGGVFGSSTLSGLFNRESSTGDASGAKAFERQGNKSLGDPAQGLRGVFGAPTLGQQLQQLKDSEQKQLHELAWALEQVGVSAIPA
ncbi:putative membrane protein [Pseudomonas asplenii]|uniref:Putative membrane protein n=2 Tax=Pseudomonas asplenii TaxID=53407 RepID=A0A0N0VKN1_9PSED|nr:putative membrane protein [Pseudomonas fuscovaginae]